MYFKTCPRAAGRPKKKRFGAPSILKSNRKDLDKEMSKENNEQTEGTKKRGRPKG